MTRRGSAVVAALALVIGAGAAWMGKPEHEVNMSGVGELWADVFRDADQFGLQVTRVSAADEMALGKRIAGTIGTGNASAAAWTSYVETVGRSLEPYVQRKDIRYEFHVIDEPVVNAFALPGGQVFIYTGLLDLMETEAELAGVLGHEMAHVDARHCIERYQYRLRLQKHGLQDLAVLARLPQVILQQGYGRFQETEADGLGLAYAFAAGYEPEGIVRLFSRMMGTTGAQAGAAPNTPLGELADLAAHAALDYFRSHPPTGERMRRLEARIGGLPRGRQVYRGKENHSRRVARQQTAFEGELISR